MRIAFANDHAATAVRAEILQALKRHGAEVVDFGVDCEDPVDYPDMAEKAVRALQRGEVDRAVLACGTGLGMSITANKFKGIRCALCTDEYAARMARARNDANVLALRGREIEPGRNAAVIDVFLRTEYQAGRHQRRLDKVSRIEGDEDRTTATQDTRRGPDDSGN